MSTTTPSRHTRRSPTVWTTRSATSTASTAAQTVTIQRKKGAATIPRSTFFSRNTRKKRTPDDFDEDDSTLSASSSQSIRARRSSSGKNTAHRPGNKSQSIYSKPTRKNEKIYILAVHIKAVKKVNPSIIDVIPTPSPFIVLSQEYCLKTTFDVITKDVFSLIQLSDDFMDRFDQFDCTFKTMGLKIWNGTLSNNSKSSEPSIVKILKTRQPAFLKTDDEDSDGTWKAYAKSDSHARYHNGKRVLDVGVILTVTKPASERKRLSSPESRSSDDSPEIEITAYVPPKKVQIVIRGPVTKDDTDLSKTATTTDLGMIELDMKGYVDFMTHYKSSEDSYDDEECDFESDYYVYQKHILLRFKNALCKHIISDSVLQKEYRNRLST